MSQACQIVATHATLVNPESLAPLLEQPLGAGLVCVLVFPLQPLGNFCVQNVVKLDVSVAQNLPGSVIVSELHVAIN